jgi:hypothetical protein
VQAKAEAMDAAGESLDVAFYNDFVETQIFEVSVSMPN